MIEIAPKSINIFALPSLPFEQKNNLPSLACLYLVLSSSNEVLYIRRSKNLCKRWKQHHCQQEVEKLERIKIAWLTKERQKFEGRRQKDYPSGEARNFWRLKRARESYAPTESKIQ